MFELQEIIQTDILAFVEIQGSDVLHSLKGKVVILEDEDDDKEPRVSEHANYVAVSSTYVLAGSPLSPRTISRPQRLSSGGLAFDVKLVQFGLHFNIPFLIAGSVCRSSPIKGTLHVFAAHL